MEEVDSIIMHFLKDLNIEIKDNIKSISDLPVEVIVESATRCINAINPQIKVPSKLPPGVSQRIDVAAQVASLCKDLGYQNDVGYQTFLYHNETELRQLFMFLIEKLPSEDQKLTTRLKSTNKKLEFYQDISNKIAQDLNAIWIPPCCTPAIKNTFDYSEHINVSSENMKHKIIKINQIRNSNTHNMKFQSIEKIVDIQNYDNKINTNTYECDKTLKELKETTILLRQKLDRLESEKNLMDVEYVQAQKKCEQSAADLHNLESILCNVGFDVTETDVTENILEKVQSNLSMLHRKSEDITSKNLSIKLEIEKLRALNSFPEVSKESERNRCKSTLTNLKETAKSIKEECERKEELRNILKAKHEKLRGGNKRHIYTKRILEIIGNVEKQNAEIKKILQDTRQLQKEINTLEGQLDRCFSIADETLFKDAKRDDQAKKAYKLLALLHSECNTIVSLVNETGILSRDIIDLEESIKAEKSKRTEDVLKKIQLDLTKLQKDN